MCLKPAPVRPLLPELVAWAARHLPPESPYRLVGDLLYPDLHDDQFADLYHREGRPAISPVILSLVTLFQAWEDLSDRAATFAAIDRKSWQYAMHLPSDYAGFDASILVDFRKRLLANDAEARIFEHVLHTMQVLKLFSPRGIQRTDSLALFTKARKLTRLEFMVETVRVTLRAVLKADNDWARAHLPGEWDERYGKICRSERLDTDKTAAMSVQTGDDGQALLDLLDAEESPAQLRELYAVTVLRTVWSQHYVRGEDGHMAWVKPGGSYDGATRIETPHDPEARWGAKRDEDWTGYKLQVTESDDPDRPHFITDIAVTSAEVPDCTALTDIRERQKGREVLPRERYVDRGYVRGTTLAKAESFEEELLGYVPERPAPQKHIEGGITAEQFQIDIPNRLVTCPGGKTASINSGGKWGLKAEFRASACHVCPLRPRCCTGKNGRTLSFSNDHVALEAARKRQDTVAFKEAYRRHRSGVEACLSALTRGQGVRHSRYTGRGKNHLRALFIGAAVNLDRGAAWRAGKRPRQRKQHLGLSPGGVPARPPMP